MRDAPGIRDRRDAPAIWPPDSLQKVGVTPDEIVPPTAEDLRMRRNPVLARAITRAGAAMIPEEAGTIFEN